MFVVLLILVTYMVWVLGFQLASLFFSQSSDVNLFSRGQGHLG